jgi:HJR/Mrr/RecB family endonuclease
MDHFLDIVEQSIPLFFLLGMIILVFKLYERRQLSKFERSGVDRLDSMDDREFLGFLEELFNRLGYTVERAAPSGAGTVVLLLRNAGERTAVFGVRTAKQIGLREVQEVISAKKNFDCRHGIVVTNSTFNYPSKAVARKESIAIWDRGEVAERMIETAEKKGCGPGD